MQKELIYQLSEKKNLNPEISVIVPIYNVEKFLERCIESILAQTFTFFELILIDDGSIDTSAQICENYALKDSRVFVIHQENRGVSVARNKGVHSAKGSYVTFIDGDDWIAPEYLEILYLNLINHHADISVCDAEWVTEVKDVKKEWKYTSKVYNGFEAIQEYGINSYNKFRLPFGKLVKKEIVEKFLFPEDRSVAEDMAVIYKWYYEAQRIVDIDVAPYYYYQNQMSVSHSSFNIKKLQFLQTIEEILSFLEKERMDEVYEGLLHEYLFKASWQRDMCVKELNDVRLAKELEIKIRDMIQKNKKKYTITPKQDAYALNTAYPKLMKMYWRAKHIKELVEEKGIISSCCYIIERIKRRFN